MSIKRFILVQVSLCNIAEILSRAIPFSEEIDPIFTVVINYDSIVPW